MRNRMYGGVRGRKTRVGEKLHRFPPTRFMLYGVSSLECRGGISYPPLCPFDDLQDAAFGKSILRILG